MRSAPRYNKQEHASCRQKSGRETTTDSLLTMTHSLLKSLTLLAAATSALAQLPANVTDLKTIDVGDGRAVRYKNPKLCETTEGVNSYSGFVDIAEDKHMFFWFFETRGDKANDPTTLWLNGGPVSLQGLSYRCLLTRPGCGLDGWIV